MSPSPRSALVFGGSGQIGEALLQRLRGQGWEVSALSRAAQEGPPGVRWLRGEFAALPPLPDRVDVIFSTGPLDLFSHWYAASTLACPRVIAFGSTSLDTKRASRDEGERELAQRLHDSEQRVFAAARERDAQATLLRPTLVYGAGRDQTLSRIAAMARRSRWFALPSDARGLRQPVHVADLADAALACVAATASHGRSYAVPGGETLEYREMVRRTLAALSPRPRLLTVPAPLFRAALALARRSGRLRGLGDAAVARMREDLAFDAGPAQRDFGYAPRAFRPEAGMF